MTVFISGSRDAHLDDQVKTKILDWIEKGYDFLVGDCRGVDTEAQSFLADNHCRRVTVCFSTTVSNSATCRNIDSRHTSLGWKQRGIVTNERPYTRAFYTSKDIVMSKESDISLVVWDGRSAGSKANITRATSLGKKVAVRVGDTWLHTK